MKTPTRKVIIPAGATWTDSVAWLTVPYIYKDVASVQRQWPTRMTVTSHGIPDGLTVPIYVANSGALRIDTTPDAPMFANRAGRSAGMETTMKKGYSKMPPMMPGALGMPPPAMKAAPKQKPKMPAKKRGR